MSSTTPKKKQSTLGSFFAPPAKLAPLASKRRENDSNVNSSTSNTSSTSSAAKRVPTRDVMAQLEAVSSSTTADTSTANTNNIIDTNSHNNNNNVALHSSLTQFGSVRVPSQFSYHSAPQSMKQPPPIDLTRDESTTTAEQTHSHQSTVDLTADNDDDASDGGFEIRAQKKSRIQAGPTAHAVFESFAFNDKAPLDSVRVVAPPIPTFASSKVSTPKLVNSRQLPPTAMLSSQMCGSTSFSMPYRNKNSSTSGGKAMFLPSTTALDADDVKMLTDEQRAVFSLVDRGENVFFTGSAGTGKSLLLTVLIRHLRERWGQEEIAVTASTGAAAVNIGGTTLHTFAGIGLGKKPVAMLAESAKKNEQVRRRWQRCKVLIVDEISMIPADLFDKIEYVARHVRSERGRPNHEPFGGIRIVLAGDFLQLPPVPEHGQQQSESQYAFQSSAWKFAVKHHVLLHQVHRQRDESFVTLLNDLRRGRYTDSARQLLMSRRNVKLQRPVRLYSRRVDVAAENAGELARLQGELMRFVARDTVKFDQYREQLDKFCNAPAVLDLKIGAQVLLLKNLSVLDGLVNGSQGTVMSFTTDKRRLPSVRFANGLERVIEPSEWTIEIGGVECAKRSQVPLMLAWAISIHKSQGLTLDEASCDLGSVFTTGQAYVALSRVRSLNGLSITSLPSNFATDPLVVDFYSKLEQSSQKE